MGPPLCGGFFWSPEDIDFGSTGPLWEDRPTGHPAGGAFAPYERFAAGKTSAQAESISAEHFNQRVEAAFGGWNPKRET
ncbi:MAG TPA: hypothetical protein H9719_05985 [Candidatus Intestinimonas stercoravium]|nr:hypothetical protein [Candidatus Intestinimonas stercoravium]